MLANTTINEKESSHKQLKQTVANVTSELNQLKEKYQEKISANLTLTNEYTLLDNKYQQMKNNESSISYQLDQLSKEHHILKQDHDQLQLDIEHERSLHLNKLKEAHDNLQLEKDKIRQHLKQLSANNADDHHTSSKSYQQLKKEKNRYKVMASKLRHRLDLLMKQGNEHNIKNYARKYTIKRGNYQFKTTN